MEEEKKILGEPTFIPIGCNRFRCLETGHELLKAEKERYSSSKKCREALFDRALKEARAPLNYFEQSPDKRDRIICKLTGAEVNKNEKAVWKHVLGKGFSNKLSLQEKNEVESPENAETKKEGGDMADVLETIMFEGDDGSMDDGDDPQLKKKKKGRTTKKMAKEIAGAHHDVEAMEEADTGRLEKKKKKKKRNTEASINEPNEAQAMDEDDAHQGNKKARKKNKASKKETNEPDGDDTGREEKKKAKKKNKAGKLTELNDEELSGDEDTETRVKRTGLAVGPSSFASRKKKRRTDKQ